MKYKGLNTNKLKTNIKKIIFEFNEFTSSNDIFHYHSKTIKEIQKLKLKN